MLVWSRFGIIVPILWIAVTGFAIETGLEAHIQKPFSSSLIVLITGIMCFFIGRYMNKDSQKVLTDEHGQSVILDRSHSFFFVKVENWLYVSMVLAVLFVLAHK